MTIGQLARFVGVADSAIRFYERLGLLEPVGRTASFATWSASFWSSGSGAATRVRTGAWASNGSVAMAAASSACCWLPLVAAALGLGAGGAAAVLERYRWVFLGVASVLLCFGYYLNYRREEPCVSDGSCPPQRSRLRMINRILLWSSAALVVIFALLPELRAAACCQLRRVPIPATRPSRPLSRLSRDGRELRDAFNRDVGSVRLVALLSPT